MCKGVKQIIQRITEQCNIKKIINLNNKWKNDYKTQNYIFMSRENIYKDVSKILNKTQK